LPRPTTPPLFPYPTLFRSSTFVATRSTGLPSCLSHWATCWSPAVRPSRPSTANRIRSTSLTAASTRCWIGLSQRSPDHRPPVSSSVNVRSSSATTIPSLTSRVTPGWSATMASCEPTSRLNRADLPTLGRPTIATLAKARPRPHAAPVGPVAGAHLPAARRPDGCQAHGALAGAHDERAGVGGEPAARAGRQASVPASAGQPRQRLVVGRGDAHARDLHAPLAVRERGAGPGRHAAVPGEHRRRGVVPPDVAVRAGEERREG